MKGTIIICLLFIVMGCKHAPKQALLKIDGHPTYYVSEKTFIKTIRSLLKSNKSDSAFKIINEAFKSNKENGFLYFEKGFVEVYNLHTENALRDFKKAQKLNYNKAACKI